jgi:hypothetical protein
MSSTKKKRKSKDFRIGYMCGVSFQHDLDPDNKHQSEIFGNVKALKEKMTCSEECGIVKVKVTLQEWVSLQDLGRKK